MLGDLLSSFAKRRLGRPSGHNFPVLDQFFEGALPFLLLSPYFGLGFFRTGFLIIIFCIGLLYRLGFLQKYSFEGTFSMVSQDFKSHDQVQGNQLLLFELKAFSSILSF
jgi:hypothetical protein